MFRYSIRAPFVVVLMVVLFCAAMVFPSEMVWLTVVMVFSLTLLAVALGPITGLAFYLAPPESKLARTNLGVGILTAFVGLFVGGLVFDPVARTPPAQAYLIVGAWLGGASGVVLATLIRYAANPRIFRLQRSLRSWFVVLSLVCAACVLVAFVWRQEW